MVVEARLQSVGRMARSTQKSVTQDSPFEFAKEVIFYVFVERFFISNNFERSHKVLGIRVKGVASPTHQNATFSWK
jgi:hypothetical protein